MKGKLIFLALVAGFLLIGGAWYMTKPKEASPGNTESAISASAVNALARSGEDRDGDGLSDWEERLWGTNPDLADSDGDGTSDKEEISLKRDPLLPGPNDQQVSLNPSTTSASLNTGPTTDFSEDSFAYSFAETYVNLESGGTLTTAEKDALAQKLLTDVYGNEFLITQKTADLGQINRISENTAATYSAYAKNFVRILKENSPEKPENEAEVLDRALRTGNAADFAKLGEIAASHEKTAADLLSLPTPSGLALAHLEVINSIYNVAIAVRGMERANLDPMAALAGIHRYAPATTRLQGALVALGNELARLGVSFSSAK